MITLYKSSSGFGIIHGYVDDADFLAKTGITPQQGDYYFNVTDNVYKYYDGGDFRVLTILTPPVTTDNAIAKWNGSDGSSVMDTGILINNDDDILWETDNDSDIGGVGAGRPSNIYVGSSVHIGDVADSAAFSVHSTTLGMLGPRMSEIERNSIVLPETGLFVYNTDSNRYEFYDGSDWQVFVPDIGDEFIRRDGGAGPTANIDWGKWSILNIYTITGVYNKEGIPPDGIPTWDDLTEYNEGERVIDPDDNQIYEAIVIQTTAGEQPMHTPSEWELKEQHLPLTLTSKDDNVVINTCSDLDIWSNLAEYDEGERVIDPDDNQIYEAIVEITTVGQQPKDTPGEWALRANLRRLVVNGSVSVSKHLLYAGDGDGDIGSADDGTTMLRPDKVFVKTSVQVGDTVEVTGTQIHIGKSVGESGTLKLGAAEASVSGNAVGDVTVTPASGKDFVIAGNVTGIVESFSGHIETAEDKVYTLDFKASYKYTINVLDIVSGTGTCKVTVKIGSTAITGIDTISVSTAPTTATATANNSVGIGDTVTVTVSDNAFAEDVIFTLKITRS